MDTSNVSSVDDSVLQMFGSEGMQQFISLGFSGDLCPSSETICRAAHKTTLLVDSEWLLMQERMPELVH
jgi:hypothetical protein